MLALALAVPALALEESDVEAAVSSSSREAVTGNVLVWFLCAVGFLKVSQKIDSFMASIGVNVGHTGGSMLGEAMVAFKGVSLAAGMAGKVVGNFADRASSRAGAAASGSSGFLQGGLAGVVSRKITNDAVRTATQTTQKASSSTMPAAHQATERTVNAERQAASVVHQAKQTRSESASQKSQMGVTHQQVASSTRTTSVSSLRRESQHSVGLGGRIFTNSMLEGGRFANDVIGMVAAGDLHSTGSITGEFASQALSSYMGITAQGDAAPQISYSNIEIGGGRITGTEYSPEHPDGISFGMYHTGQYAAPDGEHQKVFSADGVQWYKQYAVDTVIKKPFTAPDGEIDYHTSVWNGNVAVCGHNRGAKYVIGSIKDLDVGDKITYTTSMGTRTYLVETVTKISSSDWSYLSSTTDNRMTLLNHSERIPNTTFEIRKVDDALVDTVTTDKNGRVFVALEDGSYYAKEVTSNKSFRLDDTPHYFEIKDGKRVTLQVTNKKLSGIVIHKIDSATGEGIYGVKFVLYDANKKPIGEYTSDDRGYIYIDEIPGGLSGRFYLRELEAAPGYTLDKQYKTVYVSPGKTVEIEWENTAVTGQIQIYKYAAEYNEVTGTAAGTPLKGAVYEIVNARSGKVVDYITTDARGVAASKPLPLTRYQLREVTAPAYWQLDPTVHDVTLEYPGQIIKLSAYDKPSSLGVSITKRGNAQVMAGQSMRYDLTVANTSNVPLESFFWHDKIPYDVARPTTLTTGTYSARLNYRVLYKTNYNASYQVLASNLLTSNNYSFSLNAIPMQAGEVVTDIYFDFGKVPVGFQSTVNPTLSVMVNGNAVNGYQMVNRADVGGKYQGTWQTATASWVTIIRRLWNTPTLPKTGY